MLHIYAPYNHPLTPPCSSASNLFACSLTSRPRPELRFRHRTLHIFHHRFQAHPSSPHPWYVDSKSRIARLRGSSAKGSRILNRFFLLPVSSNTSVHKISCWAFQWGGGGGGGALNKTRPPGAGPRVATPPPPPPPPPVLEEVPPRVWLRCGHHQHWALWANSLSTSGIGLGQ